MRESANCARFIISCPYLSLFVGITIILSPRKGRFLLNIISSCLGILGATVFQREKESRSI